MWERKANTHGFLPESPADVAVHEGEDRVHNFAQGQRRGRADHPLLDGFNLTPRSAVERENQRRRVFDLSHVPRKARVRATGTAFTYENNP